MFSMPRAEADDSCDVRELVSSEAALRGAAVALWGIAFVAILFLWISTIDVQYAILTAVGTLCAFAVLTSSIWAFYRNALEKCWKKLAAV